MTRFSHAAVAVCGATALLTTVQASAQDANATSNKWVSTKWEILWPRPDESGNDPCEGQDTAAQLFQGYHEGASVWYKELGFRGRKVKAPVGRYQAKIVRAEDAVGIDDDRYSGVYDSTQQLIFRNEEDFFAMGEPGDNFNAPDFRVAESLIRTAVHELFHGIEASYSNNVCGEGRRWMCEGMADAALRAYHDRFAGRVTTRHRAITQCLLYRVS